MNPKQFAAMQECASLCAQGKTSLGAVIGRLTDVGLERYHAEYQGQAMNQEEIEAVQECAGLCIQDKITFGEVVGRLLDMALSDAFPRAAAKALIPEVQMNRPGHCYVLRFSRLQRRSSSPEWSGGRPEPVRQGPPPGVFETSAF